MITEKMSYEEIAKEFKIDWDSNLADRLEKIMSDSSYRKYILKNIKDEQDFYFKPVDLKVNGKNYVAQLSTRGRSEYKKVGLRLRLYMYYTSEEGTYVMEKWFSDNGNPPLFYIYPPHIFQEFRNNILKDNSLPILETIHKFFQEKAESTKFKCPSTEKYAIWTSNRVTFGKKLSDDLCLNETNVNFDLSEKEQINFYDIYDMYCDYIGE